MEICIGTPNRATVSLGALEYYAKSAETSPRTSQGFMYRYPDKNLLGIVILILFSR
jgi:hypothetical protein